MKVLLSTGASSSIDVKRAIKSIKKLKREIFYFKNTRNFLSELEKYLNDGNFYTCDKKNSKNYFLHLDYLNKRDRLLNKSLTQIL